jgi:hypothetical protein
MFALDKLVPDKEVCAQVQNELSKYVNEHGVFANLHATKDQDMLNPIEWCIMYSSWCIMYSSSTTHLHNLAMRVLSQVVSTSFAESCWRTYNFIHDVKRNNLNVDHAKSLVYVHYNLRLLSHYCEATKNDKKHMTWDTNPKEANLEDGAIA